MRSGQIYLDSARKGREGAARSTSYRRGTRSGSCLPAGCGAPHCFGGRRIQTRYVFLLNYLEFKREAIVLSL